MLIMVFAPINHTEGIIKRRKKVISKTMVYLLKVLTLFYLLLIVDMFSEENAI